MKKMSVKQLMGASAEWLMVIVVAVFLAMQSIEFWKFVTPVDKPMYAYLGFGLTGGGLIAYLAILMWRANTSLKRFIAIGMLAVCTLGELATAGFGIQIEGWRNAGFVLTETEFGTMTLSVQLLALLHAAAIIAFLAGDKLAEAFGDEDGDGVPNFRDRDYKGQNRQNSASNFNFQPKQAVQYREDAKEAKLADSPSEAGKRNE